MATPTRKTPVVQTGKPAPKPGVKVTGATANTPNKPSAIAVPNNPALAMFTQPMQSMEQLVQNIGTSPYVTFAFPRAKNYGNLIAALGAIQEGTPVIVDGNSYTLLNPFTFMFSPQYFQWYADFDSNGNIVDAIPANMCDTIPKKADGKKYSDVITAICFVLYEEMFKPVRIEFRGPKCPAFQGAFRAVDEILTNPEWFKQSKEHELMMKNVRLPVFTYLLHDCTMTHVTARKQGDSGYDKCESVSRLTPISLIQTIGKQLSEKEFADTLQACIDDHNKRNDEVMSIFKKNHPESAS